MAARGGKPRKLPRQPGRPASRDYMALANRMIHEGGNGQSRRGGGTPVLPRLSANRSGTPSAVGASRASNSTKNTAAAANRKGPKAQSRDAKERMEDMMRGPDGPASPEVHEGGGNTLARVTIDKFRSLFESNRGAFKGVSWDDLLTYAQDPTDPADVEKAMVMAAKMSEKMRANASIPGGSDGKRSGGSSSSTREVSNRTSTPNAGAMRSKPNRAATPLAGGALAPAPDQGSSGASLPAAAPRQRRPATPLVTSAGNQGGASDDVATSRDDVRRGHTSPPRRSSKNAFRGSSYHSDESDSASYDASSLDTEEEEELYRREEAKRRERRRRRQREKEKERMRRAKEKKKRREKENRRKEQEQPPPLPSGLMGLEGTSPEKGRSRYGASPFSPESPSPTKFPAKPIPVRDYGGSMKGALDGGRKKNKPKVQQPAKSSGAKSDKPPSWAKKGGTSTQKSSRVTGTVNKDARSRRLRPDYLRKG
jgi:hypothetical protein